jgi:uncharacterized protein YcfJ
MKTRFILLLLCFSSNIGATEVIRVPVISVMEVYNARIIWDPPTRNCVRRQVSDSSYENDIFGGVVGALVGHVVTRKLSSSTINRVLGTAAGAVIGSKVSNSIYSNNHTSSRIITTCSNNVRNYHTVNVISGYDVTYRIHGMLKTTRFQYRPGSTISISVNHRYTVLK